MRRNMERARRDTLELLHDDALLHALSFLDPLSLVHLSTTSRRLCVVARKPQLWLPLCLKAWGLENGTPLASLVGHMTGLHSLYAHIVPSWPRELYKISAQGFCFVDEHTVQYTGSVPGLGNRSIRSTTPFPSTAVEDAESRCCDVWTQLRRMMECLAPVQHRAKRGCPHAAAAREKWTLGSMLKKVQCQNPSCGGYAGEKEEEGEGAERTVPMFSAPVALPGGRFDVSPRSVAYYEVTIGSEEATEQNDGDNGNPCVAVGLATEEFPLNGLMPGWSTSSWALHSDDGAIFHAAGIKLRYFSQSFGATDTVGCGIDYQTREIFFTLNGKLLGVAFSDVNGALYPTVGIDTQAPIHVNFGDRPFMFALDTYHTEREALREGASESASS